MTAVWEFAGQEWQVTDRKPGVAMKVASERNEVGTILRLALGDGQADALYELLISDPDLDAAISDEESGPLQQLMAAWAGQFDEATPGESSGSSGS